MSDDDMIRRGDALRIVDEDESAAFAYEQIRSLPAMQVAVKPLEWVEETDGSGWYALFMGYQFAIRKTSRGFRYWCFDASYATFYPTLEAAKAAAQADYEARIRSALTVQPSPDVVEIDLRAVMMEEIEDAASQSPWVPPEYTMNEVVSDCCAFLREPRSQSPDVAALVEALQPFASCADELDYDTKETGREYPDDEWAKFRLLVSDYRRARATLARVKGGAE